MIAGRMKERNCVELADSIEFGNVTLQGMFGLPERVCCIGRPILQGREDTLVRALIAPTL